jgi:hypothetical protein
MESEKVYSDWKELKKQKEKDSQEAFQYKVLKIIRQRYKDYFNLNWNEIEHINTLDRFASLEGRTYVGCYKQSTPQLKYGSLLYKMEKTKIGTAFRKFLEFVCEDYNSWIFVVSISSTRVPFVITGANNLPDVESMTKEGVVVAYKVIFGEVVAILTLDDYLNIKWPKLGE